MGETFGLPPPAKLTEEERNEAMEKAKKDAYKDALETKEIIRKRRIEYKAKQQKAKDKDKVCGDKPEKDETKLND